MICDSFRIGGVTIPNTTVLAPLAGITDLPFRRLAKSWGCGLVCSEMISSNGLVHGSPKTRAMLDGSDDEKPLSIQIFGADPDIMAKAAGLVQASGADIIDINFGCSVKKILKTGAGAALMKDAGRTAEILESVRKAVNIPLTIKIRSGWDPSGKQAIETAKIAESSGVDAVAVHPRTAAQGFRGAADWKIIGQVKQNVSIPVIGNGDIVHPENAIKMFETTGCDAVMIGRGSIGAPWIFSNVTALCKGREITEISIDQRFDTLISYLHDSVEYHGEKHACFMMRSRLGWFAKGMPHSSHFRESINQIESAAQAMEKIQAYRSFLEESSIRPEHGPFYNRNEIRTAVIWKRER